MTPCASICACGLHNDSKCTTANSTVQQQPSILQTRLQAGGRQTEAEFRASAAAPLASRRQNKHQGVHCVHKILEADEILGLQHTGYCMAAADQHRPAWAKAGSTHPVCAALQHEPQQAQQVKSSSTALKNSSHLACTCAGYHIQRGHSSTPSYSRAAPLEMGTYRRALSEVWC